MSGVTVSRRNIIAAICASGVVAACGSAALEETPEEQAAAAAASNGKELANGAAADWSRLAGTVFRAGGSHALRLAGVESLPSPGARPADVTRASAFVVVFDAVAGALPGDLIYALSAPDYGPLDVFLSDASSPEFPGRMHAVFN